MRRTLTIRSKRAEDCVGHLRGPASIQEHLSGLGQAGRGVLELLIHSFYVCHLSLVEW